MSKILVVATSRKTRGGITSVVKTHEQGAQWDENHCHWIQTHRDGAMLCKVGYLAIALLDYSFRLPFYDLVHIHFSNGNSMKRKLIFAKMARSLRKKIIIHFHAFDPQSTLNGPDKEQYKRFFEMADKIIVLSEWWKQQVENIYPKIKDKIEVLCNPCQNVSLDDSIPKMNHILYAGTVNARKGYSDLIRAFAKIADKHPDWKVVLAGNGEVEEGKQLASSLGIAQQVEFLGWVNGNAKQKAFQEASIFCLPSYAEGFPMAVLDAWAYGLPVITTPVGGIPDVAKDGENMLLFNPGDIGQLTSNIEKMIDDENLRKKISKASTEFAHGTFSIDAINNQLASIYESLS